MRCLLEIQCGRAVPESDRAPGRAPQAETGEEEVPIQNRTRVGRPSTGTSFDRLQKSPCFGAVHCSCMALVESSASAMGTMHCRSKT
mmetsp:Transcript_22050/g.48723  ORF Transcript_22050/g.48723 Transcript_22050/m.48723 type:complete len:87 (-) Transcript_22050:399-659(-)